MKSFLSTIVFCLFFVSSLGLWAQKEEATDTTGLSKAMEIYKFESEIPYKTGKVDLSDKITLNIPSGYKFIPKKESEKIVFEIWGNPKREGVSGMLVLNNYSTLDAKSWAFIMQEEADGYVKDEDAADINYDDLLKQMQDEEEEENEERKKMGYEAIYTVGWASKPFYDSKNKILHWAKELRFDGTEENTLNYEVRILGRDGLLSMNAVGGMSVLDSVKKHIPEIIHIAQYKKGHSYFDFDPSVDKIAAYSIGGLVAGKLLAKAGLLALLLKNIKLVLLGAAGLFSLFKKKIFGLFGKKEEEYEEEITPENENDTDQIS